MNPKQPFTIIDIINDAWRLVHGHKGPLWAIAIFIGVTSIVLQFLISWIFHIDPQNPSITYRYLIMPLVNNIIIAPFFGGAVMVAVLCARGKPVHARTGFGYLSQSVAVIITMFLIALLANIITYLVHLPQIAIALNGHIGWLNLLATLISILVYVFCFISVPLVLDKNKSPVAALITSFHLIKHYWFKTLILLIIIYVFLIIAMIPLYIGAMIHPYAKLAGAVVMVVALIWLMPFVFLIQGVLYHKVVDTGLDQQ